MLIKYLRQVGAALMKLWHTWAKKMLQPHTNNHPWPGKIEPC